MAKKRVVTRTISAKVDVDLLNRLEQYTNVLGMSKTACINMAIQDFLEVGARARVERIFHCTLPDAGLKKISHGEIKYPPLHQGK